MNTNKGFAPIVAIIVGVIIIAGGIGGYLYIKNKNKSSLPDYYKNLAKECESRGSYGCCMSSVDNMANGNYKLAPETGCPEGYRANGLECVDSFTWCQTIPTSTGQNISTSTNTGTLKSCLSDQDCDKGYVCYDSQYKGMGPNGIVLGEQNGDLLCHKSCKINADCGNGKCLERESWMGDVGSAIMFCDK